MEDRLRRVAEGAAILAAAEPATKDTILQAAEVICLDVDQYLFKRDDPSDALFIVVEGQLEVLLDATPDSTARILIGPANAVGELQVFVGGRRTADVRVTERASVLRVPRQVILKAADTQPGVFDSVLELIRIRLRRNQLRAALPHLFGRLDEASSLAIEEMFEWQRYERGELLFAMGDPPDGMYLVLSGRLSVFLPNPDGGEIYVGEVHRGEFVGEMASLTDEPRSASVRALRDSRLVRLSRDAVHQLAERHPQLLIEVTKVLINRHRQQYSQTPKPPEVRTIAVVGLTPDVPTETLARQLCLELESFSSSRTLAPDAAALALGLSDATNIAPGHSHYSRVTTWLAEQESQHEHLILLAGHGSSNWAETCVRHADLLLLVAHADGDPTPQAVERELLGESGAAGVPTRLVLLHPVDTKRPSNTARWLEPRSLERHYHVRLERQEDVARLARMATGKALGVVLGGGGARGGAHIGVLRALRAAGVHIDAVGGTSAGAGIAALYAMGLEDAEILETCIDGFVKNSPFRQFTLPITSLVRRNKMDEQAYRMYGDVQIEDLWHDFFCVATNLTKGSTEILSSGPLWKAIRTTTSLPGVAVPVIHDGDLLIDGGVMDNLPGRYMRKLVGGKVISVDVSPTELMQSSYSYEDLPGPWRVLWSRINPFSSELRVPSIPGVIMRSMTVGSQAERDAAWANADLLLQPPISRYGMFDFSALPEMADEAEHYTTELLQSLSDELPVGLQNRRGQP